MTQATWPDRVDEERADGILGQMFGSGRVPGAETVVILSPHRDDAAFSCGLLMSLCVERGTPVRVVNVFTQSEYAPYVGMEPAAERLLAVSAVRLQEDRAMVRRLEVDQPAADRAVVLDDLGMTDAPVRLNLPVEQVLSQAILPDDVRKEAEVVAVQLRGQLQDTSALVFAPLALGGHVDHRIVREAALMAVDCHQLALYEDLPYVARISEGERLGAIHATLGEEAAAEPIVVPVEGSSGSALKRELAGLYASQIDAAVAEEIADYAERVGGERFYACWGHAARLHGMLRGGEPRGQAGLLS